MGLRAVLRRVQATHRARSMQRCAQRHMHVATRAQVQGLSA